VAPLLLAGSRWGTGGLGAQAGDEAPAAPQTALKLFLYLFFKFRMVNAYTVIFKVLDLLGQSQYSPMLKILGYRAR